MTYFSNNEVSIKKRYLTSEEVSAYTGIKPKTLDRFTHLNQISYIKRGRRRYFDIAEVDAFMKAGLVPARKSYDITYDNELEGGGND